MSSRVGGVLALTAAVVLAVSSFPVGRLIDHREVSSWWSGYPTIGEHVYRTKEVHIGLLFASGCNVQAEELVCETLPLGGGFKVMKYVQFGLVLILGLALLLLGVTMISRAALRRMFGKIVLGAAAASAIMSIVLVVMGPNLKTGKAESVPIALVGGLGLFFLGTALSIIAGILSSAPDKAVQPGWANQPMPPQRPSAQQLPTPQPVLDVLALLQEDQMRPSGPEPRLQRGQVASPGGMLAGPSGPLSPVPQSVPQSPLFASAPQLRPLYEVGDQNGAPGFVMPSPPPLPIRGPTPMPHAAVSALTGIPTPPPMAAVPPPPANKTLPPPIRRKPPTLPPPAVPLVPPKVSNQSGPRTPINRALPTIAGPAVPPPSSTPAPAPVLFPHQPISTPGGTLAGPPSLQLPRPQTDPDDDELDGTASFEKETVDRSPGFDAMATVARESGRHQVDTDQQLLATGDSTSPSVPFESTTSEGPEFSGEIPTAAEPLLVDNPLEPVNEGDELETRARERVSAPMVAVEAPRVSSPILTSAAPQPAARKTPRPMPAAQPTAETPAPQLPPAPPAPRKSGEVKVPISTASQSLPPPKEKASALAGPSPACPQCEAPMAWVEEHLRFYCKSCRMYF